MATYTTVKGEGLIIIKKFKNMGFYRVYTVIQSQLIYIWIQEPYTCTPGELLCDNTTIGGVKFNRITFPLNNQCSGFPYIKISSLYMKNRVKDWAQACFEMKPKLVYEISAITIPTGILYMKHGHYKESSLCNFASLDLTKKKRSGKGSHEVFYMENNT